MLVEQHLMGRTFEPEAPDDDGEPVGDRGIVPPSPQPSPARGEGARSPFGQECYY